jgi:F5/8 type C domain
MVAGLRRMLDLFKIRARARLLPAMLCLVGLIAPPGLAMAKQSPARLLDGMNDAGAWRVSRSDQVAAALHDDHGALRLDFDFNGVAGYAALRRPMPIDFKGNFALSLRVRGEAPDNTLQVKLIDASGDNVWWIKRPNFVFNGKWQTIRAERRRIAFAWGPAQDRSLHRIAAVEIAVAAGKGGRGRVWFDDLTLQPLPPVRTTWPAPVVRASSALPQAPAALAMDRNGATAWRSDPAGGARQTLDIDFGAPRPFGGLVLHWLPRCQARQYAVQFSGDGRHWRTVRRVRDGNGGTDPLLLTDSQTRYVRLALEDGPDGSYGLSEIDVEASEWGADPNLFFEALARTGRHGLYPRGFSGQQSYWTIVGVDGGGAHAALMSEDGAVELSRGGFSLEPFLIDGGHLLTWADVHTIQALDDGYLPMPGVTWQTADVNLHIAAFAAGDQRTSSLHTDYTAENRTDHPREVILVLAVRPFQVNPPAQFLNTPGGVSPIHRLAWVNGAVDVEGRPRVFPLQTPEGFVAASFDAGGVVASLDKGHPPASSRVDDSFGFASGALLFRLTLPPHGRRTINVLAPLSGHLQVPKAARRSPALWTAQQREAVAAGWRTRLDAVRLHLPASAQALGDTVRTALAHILISRDGPALQPGTRSYARTWIRDGAMMCEGLLRLGRADVVDDFIRWYAPHQFDTGKVPCVVDARGADPVPENDSPGEMIFTIAELFRFTHDRAALEVLWPHVVRAFEYMERLRASERSDANRTPGRLADFGLMPASISHEGYAAKPVHSYWDDFWALKGYDDAVDLARALDKRDETRRMTAARDQFRSDLEASLRNAVAHYGIDYLPGSAELGDFDPTSTTVALSPGDEQARLPQELLNKTFSRYWDKFLGRRGSDTWSDYTPYELRIVGAFTRLGRRDCVGELLDFFMADRRPAAWNGWAEVVRRDARTPGFIGDMPHAWIASDYIRSVLDMLAYRRTADQAMVLAAGVPAPWLKNEGIGIANLHTPWGRLSYSLRRDGDRLHLRIDAQGLPPGGFVLPWPYAAAPAAPQIEGRGAEWRDGALHVFAAQADIRIRVEP